MPNVHRFLTIVLVTDHSSRPEPISKRCESEDRFVDYKSISSPTGLCELTGIQVLREEVYKLWSSSFLIKRWSDIENLCFLL